MRGRRQVCISCFGACITLTSLQAELTARALSTGLDLGQPARAASVLPQQQRGDVLRWFA